MTTITLSVPTVSCSHCKSSIEGAVAVIDGVDSVTVNIDPKTVDLSYDGSDATMAAIIEAIEDQGYDVDR